MLIIIKKCIKNLIVYNNILVNNVIIKIETIVAMKIRTKNIYTRRDILKLILTLIQVGITPL